MTDAEKIISCFKNGGKLLICGNGGSAAMSQHMAAEFMCKFEKERDPLPAIALTADTTFLTAVSNDFDFTHIFSRQIQALGKTGDVLVIFSTSDFLGSTEELPHSINLRYAKGIAFSRGMYIVIAPRSGNSTAQIQENQLQWMHNLVRVVENAFA